MDDELKAHLEGMEGRITETLLTISDGLDERFTAVDNTLKQIQERLNRIEQQLGLAPLND